LHSVPLLLLVGCLIAVPGIAAALAAFPPGEVSVVTRMAAAFGLGYAAAGGCAFVLAAAHVFWLASFLPFWLAVSAALWVVALRRAPVREHARAIRADLAAHPLPLLLGAFVVVALLASHFRFLYLLDARHYVYFLNGVYIANSHGVPAAVLEYGQAWPQATDKIFLDAFTAAVALLNSNVVLGPGVLLWLAVLGAALGLWATGWELGLHRTGGLLPLLLLGNRLILSTNLGARYTGYRAEDFGLAVASCALALGIVAIRQGGWRRAAVAGVVLGAASGSHLIPVVVVVIALCFVGVAELLRGRDASARLATLRYGIALAATGGVLGVAIRVFAGGSFGLEGASNQFSYAATSTAFDPTAYLLHGKFLPRHDPGSHWYLTPRDVIDSIMSEGTGAHWGLAAWLVLLASALLTAILLFLLARTDLRTVGVVGSGIMAGVLAVALYFSYRYHVFIEGTFGVRRMHGYTSLGLILVGLGLAEALLMLLDRAPARASIAAAIIPVIAVIALTGWLLPSTAATHHQVSASRDLLQFTNWVRTHTPCGARFLSNQRPTGIVAGLTGRDDISEGMGPFIRPGLLPYVINFLLDARKFYRFPSSNEAFLREHDVTYVLVAREGEMLGYGGLMGQINVRAGDTAPFLHRVLDTPSVLAYKVEGTPDRAVSPLLKGPYLYCRTTPAHF
jgi:hypothetical protein